MQLWGHRFIDSDKFYHITDIDAIKKTPPSSKLYITFNETNLDIISYANQNLVEFALNVTNITELIYASSLNAAYIVVDITLAKSAQNIAENYLFDAKILVSIEDEAQIAEMAQLGIDGVIFSNAVIKINS